MERSLWDLLGGLTDLVAASPRAGNATLLVLEVTADFVGDVAHAVQESRAGVKLHGWESKCGGRFVEQKIQGECLRARGDPALRGHPRAHRVGAAAVTGKAAAEREAWCSRPMLAPAPRINDVMGIAKSTENTRFPSSHDIIEPGCGGGT